MKHTFKLFLTNSRRILSCYQFNVLELGAVHFSFFRKLLLKWRKPVFLNEIKLASVQMSYTVLLIVCGIFPSETIIIAETTGASVVGIDNSIHAVKIAKKYVKKKGLETKVKIEYGDGTDYELPAFDIIFVAINVFPIDTVLKHLSTTMRKDAKVMCKSIEYDIPQTIEQLGLSGMFSIISMIDNPKTQSYLLKKT